MISESSIDDINQAISNKENMFVLAYTTLCGTCGSAKKMMDVVCATINSVNYLTVNVNLYKKIIDDYNITSIPCFLLFKEGKLIEKFYAFHSVMHLFEKAKVLQS